MKKKLNRLKDVRNAIDKLDDKILPLMIKRSQLVRIYGFFDDNYASFLKFQK